MYLTTDHKPDQPLERQRIEARGGSVELLHGGRPFVRGGDFLARHALHSADPQMHTKPMQINYSRAFGGKDLKPYGLSSAPSLLRVELSPADRVLVVATDGLWDVFSADDAVAVAWAAHAAGRDPASALAEAALERHVEANTGDNVSVAVVILV